VELEELTKEELLWVIHRYFLEVPQRQLLEARWHTLNKKAEIIMNEATKKMNDNVGGGIENIRLFQEASKQFDTGLALADEASQFWEVMIKA